MPELPEVESLRRLLARSAVGRTIVGAKISRVRLRRTTTSGFAASVRGHKIAAISRRGKYLLIELTGGLVLLVHLGMSGSLTHRRGAWDSHDFDHRHDHVQFALDDGTRLVYNDPRRFGIVRLTARGEAGSLPELAGLGPEPLGRGFTAEYLAGKARGRRLAIKNLLMDQHAVAGIGNIYASEILFRAGIRPTRRAGRLNRDEVMRIAEATAAVLRAAIGSGGTTFRSYRDSRGRPGRFARRLMVYGREGEPCRRCSTPIRNVRLGQRATFYCPKCQR